MWENCISTTTARYHTSSKQSENSSIYNVRTMKCVNLFMKCKVRNFKKINRMIPA